MDARTSHLMTEAFLYMKNGQTVSVLHKTPRGFVWSYGNITFVGPNYFGLYGLPNNGVDIIEWAALKQFSWDKKQ